MDKLNLEWHDASLCVPFSSPGHVSKSCLVLVRWPEVLNSNYYPKGARYDGDNRCWYDSAGKEVLGYVEYWAYPPSLPN